MFRIIAVAVVFGSAIAHGHADIRNLVGEPDYRKVRLQWEADKTTDPETFQIRYCELQSWGPQRCKNKNVSQSIDSNSIDYEDNAKIYNAEIKGLRMATTYSFEVRTKGKEIREREDRSQGLDGRNQNIVIVPTKGFSAKATQCLSHASEIEVSTGPYFGGRITVEATDGERCAVDGDPNSPRDSYTLRINHDECGSIVNETTVATFVIVQENLPILTHSTRRFLVICSYQPETLTVRAGLNLPTNKGQAFVNDEETVRKGRSSRLGRAHTNPQALVRTEDPNSTNLFPLLVLTVLSVIVVMGTVMVVLTTIRSRKRNSDNISVSGVSVASCSTTTDSLGGRCIEETI